MVSENREEPPKHGRSFCEQAHPPPLPSSGSSGARANIPSPFSAVQAPDSPGPRGHHDPGLTGRLSGRTSSRTPSQTAPSLPKPMTPAMIAEAATAKQRSRQSKPRLCNRLEFLHYSEKPSRIMGRLLCFRRLTPC